MTEADVRELAGWAVSIRVRCPDCGQEHEMLILASELVGCPMDAEGMFFGRPMFLCAACFGCSLEAA